jgi:hypothetical protein
MQHVHAKDHLLQRAGRHGADQRRITVRKWPKRSRDSGAYAAKIDDDDFMPPPEGSAAEVAHMPAIATGQKGDPEILDRRRSQRLNLLEE